MTRVCRTCGAPLIVGVNISPGVIDNRHYICQQCHANYTRIRRHRIGQCRPMSENRECSSYLGVYIAEGALSQSFENVERMPMNNHGYDFKCGNGYKIDVKSSCSHHVKNRSDLWQFRINGNQIPDYFLCLAFDNREDLNPLHIWLIPANDVSTSVTVAISESTIQKWNEYELDISKVSKYCDIYRGR